MSITIDWLHVVLIFTSIFLAIALNVNLTEVLIQHSLIQELINSGCNYALP